MSALQRLSRTGFQLRHSTLKRVTEAVYWQKYYCHNEPSDVTYEWNNGILEEKPVSNYATISVYDWFNKLLDHYLRIHPIGKKVLLEMGFRMALQHKTVIRRPDMAIVRHDNPVPLKPEDA
ncbi:MAG: hypothetical protein GY862_18280, partial [Gammaproteobacteria bacterium]|nr:hypothetical protein [Gammaproteobacteria bacterium]